MISFLFNLFILLLGLFLGSYIMLLGRRTLWLTAGIVGLTAGANLIAFIVAPDDVGWTLLQSGEWLYVAIALGVGVLTAVIGRYRPELAVLIIGFIAGLDVGFWFRDIAVYSTEVVASPEEAGLSIGLIVAVLLGIVGVYLMKQYQDGFMIMVSMLLGVEIIYRALGLPSDKSFTAVILLSLALLSVVVQYADLLRDQKRQKSSDTLAIPVSTLPPLDNSPG